jgi:hypothetical protein
LLAGCGVGTERKDTIELQIEDQRTANAELTAQLEQCRVEVEQLGDQLEALAALPKAGQENPYRLSSVRVTRFTNFYDNNDDGRREKLIVYVQPVDLDGDVIKAAGLVGVQLWDLNRPNGQALLGEWRVQPQELRKLWLDTLVAANYRLTFDAPESLDVLADPLVVKVTFTDYLTGEVFRAQRSIDPGLD